MLPSPLELASAQFEMLRPATLLVTFVTTRMVTVSFGDMVPITTVMLLLSIDTPPLVGVTEMISNPLGTSSVTTTFDSVVLDPFVTVIVNFT